jgi:hypothetical protein
MLKNFLTSVFKTMPSVSTVMILTGFLFTKNVGILSAAMFYLGGMFGFLSQLDKEREDIIKGLVVWSILSVPMLDYFWAINYNYLLIFFMVLSMGLSLLQKAGR